MPLEEANIHYEKENHVMKKFLGILTGVALLAFALAGCRPAPTPTLTIEKVWGRPSPTMPGAGGLFMVIKNAGGAADRLVSAKSDACGMVEIHETVKKSDGTMGMNLVTEPVEVPAGGQVELKSGDLHIMCLQLKEDQFKPGGKISLTLVFEKSGEKMVMADIRDQ
jgi:periplasmic copper chaperone A